MSESPSTSAHADARSIDVLLDSIGDASLDAEEDSVVIALRSALGARASDARLSRWLTEYAHDVHAFMIHCQLQRQRARERLRVTVHSGAV